MVDRIDAIFTQGAFRPIEPLSLPEGTRVQIRLEAESDTKPRRRIPKIHTPRLSHPQDAEHFIIEVRETGL